MYSHISFLVHQFGFSQSVWCFPTVANCYLKEVHSSMAIYFLYAYKKFTQRYFIHQNFSLQSALLPYEIFPKTRQLNAAILELVMYT